MTIKPNFIRTAMLVAVAPVIGFALQSCSDDDNDFPTVDGQAPTITMATNHIQAEPGRSFNIEGKAKDADGIKAIHLKSEGMLLDKTIDLLKIYGDSLIYDYDLSYAYTPASSWTDDSNFPLEVTVEDVGGRTTTATVQVSGDGDFTAPSFTVAPSAELTVLVQNPKLSLNVTVADNKKLQSLVVDIPGLDILDSVLISGNEYQFKKVYTLPSDKNSYMMSMRLYDALGNVTSTNSVINVSELPDFQKMYLADVETAAELTSDLYGVPMLIERTGEYQYKAQYYNQKAGTGVRFVPQTTDFEPICFGIDESTGLLTSSPSVAKPIVLDKVGYYEITFNTVTGDYDVKEYTPTTEKMVLDGSQTKDFGDGAGAQPFQICLAGEGLPDVEGWKTNPNDNAFILNQDKQNPYRLYREMKLDAGTKVSYTISATHWWGWWPEPFWRFDGSEGNEKNVLNGGDNMKSVEVKKSGTYRMEFDYSLLRSRIIFVK